MNCWRWGTLTPEEIEGKADGDGSSDECAQSRANVLHAKALMVDQSSKLGVLAQCRRGPRLPRFDPGRDITP